MAAEQEGLTWALWQAILDIGALESDRERAVQVAVVGHNGAQYLDLPVYQDQDDDATPAGIPAMFWDTADANKLKVASPANPFPVNIVSGGGSSTIQHILRGKEVVFTSRWAFDSTLGTGVGAGSFRRAGANATNAVTLFLSQSGTSGPNHDDYMGNVVTGDLIYVRKRTDPDAYELYEAIGDAVDGGTEWTIDVTSATWDSGPTPIANADDCQITFYRTPEAAAAAAVVPEHDNTFAGSEGERFDLTGLTASYQTVLTNSEEIYYAEVHSDGDVDCVISFDGGTTDHIHLWPGGMTSRPYRADNMTGPGGNVQVKWGNDAAAANVGHLYVNLVTA